MNSDGYPNKGLPDITTSGEFLQTNSDLRAVWGAGGGSGSTETASNVGGFTGVFKQKTGNDLEFKTLQSSDNSIILGSNTNDIDFSINDAIVNHNLLLNYSKTGNHVQQWGTGNIACAYDDFTSLTGANNIIFSGDTAFNATLGNATTAFSNTIFGRDVLPNITDGYNNIAIGTYAGSNVQGDSHDNVFLGTLSGSKSAVINGCICIGNEAGSGGTLASNRLYIDNSNTTSPLIYGEFDNNLLRANGNFDVASGYKYTHGSTNILQYGSDTTNLALGNNNLASLNASSGNDNILIGLINNNVLSTGYDNICIGNYSGDSMTTGKENVLIGHDAGTTFQTQQGNVFVGFEAGKTNVSGNNVFIGSSAGSNSSSSGSSVFIGHDAGKNETTSNRLHISNSDTATPLVLGRFDQDKLFIYGRINMFDKQMILGSDSSGGITRTNNTNKSCIFSLTHYKSSTEDNIAMMYGHVYNGNSFLRIGGDNGHDTTNWNSFQSVQIYTSQYPDTNASAVPRINVDGTSGGGDIDFYDKAGNPRITIANSGLISANSGINYETLVSGDDDFLTKKYVQDEQHRDLINYVSITNQSTYTITDEYFMEVLQTSQAITITLPPASNGYHELIVKDANDNAYTYNITIACDGSDVFEDGANTQVIDTDSGGFHIMSGGDTTWYIVNKYVA